MKTHLLLLLSGWWLALPALAGFQPLFDGTSLEGWRSNDETPGCFTVEHGALKIQGGRAHLFYQGPVANHRFKNFELTARVKTTPGSNSGIYFHTEFQARGWPAKGYECQINSTHKDHRKTGSLYGIQDVNPSPSTDGEWFDYRIRVVGRRILIQIDGETQVDWTEPDDWTPPIRMSGRSLGEGTFCLQAHDPKSTVYVKDIRVNVLPDESETKE